MWKEDLEGPALVFARSDSTWLRALAGPGTGKTFALLRRLMRLVEEGHAPFEILVVTFTRTAAEDIVGKLAKEEHEKLRELRARTLHSYCFSILSGEGFLAATGRVPRILLEFERDYLLTGLEGAFDHTLTGRRKLAIAFEAAWARLQTDNPGQSIDGYDQEFQDALLDCLRWHQAMLIGEVVPLSLSYLRHNPHAPEREAYRHVLVDEYQDLNRAEQVLINFLSGSGKLAVIGDDDQSIYGFKHANPEGIRDFAAGRPGTEDVEFTECRRCPHRVVALSQSLIEKNPGRVRARLSARTSNPLGEVHYVQWQSLEEEAEGVAAFVQHHVNAGVDPGMCLILSPSRAIGYGIRDAVSSKDIPIRSFFREEPVESEIAKEKLTLLTLMAKPDDRVALRTWIGLRSTTGLTGGYRALVATARKTGTDVRNILMQVEAGNVAVPYSAKPLARWLELKAALAELEEFRDDLPMLVKYLLPAAGAEESEDDLALLRRTAMASAATAKSLAELSDLVRYGIAQPEIPLETAYARVMSLHKSKGLTAELVVVAGMIEGLLPRVDRDALEQEQTRQREEQRRLCFVGMTRTTRILVLSSYSQLPANVVYRLQVRSGSRFGGNFVTFASSFLGEMGPELPEGVKGEDWVKTF